MIIEPVFKNRIVNKQAFVNREIYIKNYILVSV